MITLLPENQPIGFILQLHLPAPEEEAVLKVFWHGSKQRQLEEVKSESGVVSSILSKAAVPSFLAACLQSWSHAPLFHIPR